MDIEKFKRQKQRYENRTKKQITNEEFKRLLKRQQKFEMILWLVCLVVGIAMAAEWPERWFVFLDKFSIYLGFAIVVASALCVIKSIFLIFMNKIDIK